MQGGCQGETVFKKQSGNRKKVLFDREKKKRGMGIIKAAAMDFKKEKKTGSEKKNILFRIPAGHLALWLCHETYK